MSIVKADFLRLLRKHWCCYYHWEKMHHILNAQLLRSSAQKWEFILHALNLFIWNVYKNKNIFYMDWNRFICNASESRMHWNCLFVTRTKWYSILHALNLFIILSSSTSWCLIPLSAIHAIRLVIQSVRFLPLPLFPSIFPVNARFSRPSFLITCPKNLICLVSISPINVLSTPALCRTSSFVNLSVQGILIIRLKNHISQLSQTLSKVWCYWPCFTSIH